MERRSIFAATSVGRRFCPRPPGPNRKASLDAAVKRNAANDGVIPAAASRVAVCVIRWLVATQMKGTL